MSKDGASTQSPSTTEKAENAATSALLRRRVALFAILLLGAVLRLWNLAQNGWGNEYYTAGVRSMTLGWHNFFYNSFDPAGFVSVDKPPVALWIQAASAKLFGFHNFSLFLPQVLEGLAAILILYHLVQRRFGAMAGLLAALFLAVTPISVAIDRSNNTDSCLVLVLLLAAWALIRATEKGSRSLLLLSMALIGLGFNVKMLAAYVVLPTFVLVYFLGAPVALRRRVADLAISGVVLVAVSLSWVLAYDLTAPENRPFAGTTKNNSMLELAVGPYAVGRFVPPIRSSDAARSYPKPRDAAVTDTKQTAGGDTGAEPRPRSGLLRLLVRAPAGPLRLADGQLAGQVAWLAPIAFMGLALGAFQYRFGRPLAPEHLALLLWFGWAFTYGVVYSFAGGIMHLYYLATMAPPLAALAGIGVVSLWERYDQKGMGAVLLPVVLLLTAGWQLYIDASAALVKCGTGVALAYRLPNWHEWLCVALFRGTGVAVGVLFVLLIPRAWSRPRRVIAAGTFGIGTASVENGGRAETPAPTKLLDLSRPLRLFYGFRRATGRSRLQSRWPVACRLPDSCCRCGFLVLDFVNTVADSSTSPRRKPGSRGPGFRLPPIGVKLSKIPIRSPSLSLPVNGEGTHFPPLTGGLRGGDGCGQDED